MSIGSRFNPGGLFRCCIATIIEDEQAEYIGRKMTCEYCDAPMIVRQGVNHLEWEWDRDAPVSLECISQSITQGLDAEEAASDAMADHARRRELEERGM